MPIGRIKRFNKDRGFGFIESDSERIPETFVHISTLLAAGIKEPRIGMPLIFLVGERNGKDVAIDVEALKPWKIDTDSDD